MNKTDHKELTKDLWKNFKQFGNYITKFIYKYSFLTVLVFITVNVTFVLILSLLLLVGFIKSKGYRYLE